MPRNAAGVYSLPNPARVSGTIIYALDENQTRDDIAAALTDSLSRSGAGGMTAPMRFADGTMLVPGISFLNETSTGFYRAATNDVRFTMAGTDQMKWTPDYIQMMVSAFFPDGSVTVPGFGFASDFETGFYLAGVQDMRITIDGADVIAFTPTGIEATPMFTFTGGITLPNNTAFYIETFAGVPTLSMYANTSDVLFFGGGWATTSIYAGGIEKINLTGAQNTFDGPTLQDGAFYMPNNTAMHFKDFGGTNRIFAFATTSDQLVLGGVWTDLYFYSVSQEHMRINAAGGVKITNGDGAYIAAAAGLHEIVSLTAGSYSVTAANTHASNPFGLHDSFPNFASGSRDGGHYHLACSDAGGVVAAFPSNGGLYNFATNNVDISDALAKKDITASPDYTDFVERLQYRRFQYRDQPKMGDVDGIIAQDIEALAPELVVDDALNGMKGVLTHRLQARINSVIPRLIERIRALEGVVQP